MADGLATFGVWAGKIVANRMFDAMADPSDILMRSIGSRSWQKAMRRITTQHDSIDTMLGERMGSLLLQLCVGAPNDTDPSTLQSYLYKDHAKLAPSKSLMKVVKALTYLGSDEGVQIGTALAACPGQTYPECWTPLTKGDYLRSSQENEGGRYGFLSLPNRSGTSLHLATHYFDPATARAGTKFSAFVRISVLRTGIRLNANGSTTDYATSDFRVAVGDMLVGREFSEGQAAQSVASVANTNFSFTSGKPNKQQPDSYAIQINLTLHKAYDAAKDEWTFDFQYANNTTRRGRVTCNSDDFRNLLPDIPRVAIGSVVQCVMGMDRDTLADQLTRVKHASVWTVNWDDLNASGSGDTKPAELLMQVQERLMLNYTSDVEGSITQFMVAPKKVKEKGTLTADDTECNAYLLYPEAKKSDGAKQRRDPELEKLVVAEKGTQGEYNVDSARVTAVKSTERGTLDELYQKHANRFRYEVLLEYLRTRAKPTKTKCTAVTFPRFAGCNLRVVWPYTTNDTYDRTSARAGKRRSAPLQYALWSHALALSVAATAKVPVVLVLAEACCDDVFAIDDMDEQKYEMCLSTACELLWRKLHATTMERLCWCGAEQVRGCQTVQGSGELIESKWTDDQYVLFFALVRAATHLRLVSQGLTGLLKYFDKETGERNGGFKNWLFDLFFSDRIDQVLRSMNKEVVAAKSTITMELASIAASRPLTGDLEDAKLVAWASKVIAENNTAGKKLSETHEQMAAPKTDAYRKSFGEAVFSNTLSAMITDQSSFYLG